jgi:hypothetical protein
LVTVLLKSNQYSKQFVTKLITEVYYSIWRPRSRKQGDLTAQMYTKHNSLQNLPNIFWYSQCYRSRPVGDSLKWWPLFYNLGGKKARFFWRILLSTDNIKFRQNPSIQSRLFHDTRTLYVNPFPYTAIRYDNLLTPWVRVLLQKLIMTYFFQTEHHALEAYCGGGGGGGIDPRILDLGAEGGEWSASHLVCFTPRERAPSTHWIEGWMGPRAGLDAVVKR